MNQIADYDAARNFGDFWRTSEEKGLRGWLSHRWRYVEAQGCFPARRTVSRLEDIVIGIVGIAAVSLIMSVVLDQTIRAAIGS